MSILILNKAVSKISGLVQTGPKFLLPNIYLQDKNKRVL